MNILTTGAGGQLGNELRLLQGGTSHKWFNTDVAELDITDMRAVEAYVEANSIDGVVNCAAYTAVDKAETDKALCTAINAEAPAYLAAAVARRGGWMVQISTDYVFDGKGCRPYREDDTPGPQSVYGSTKLAAETAVARICPQSAIIRTSWLYSTFGNNFVKTMLRLGRERDSLGIVADQVGTPTYAADLAAAIMAMVGAGIKPGVYHYSNEGAATWYDFTKAIHRIAGVEGCKVSPIRTEEYPVPAPRPYYSVLDKAKVKRTYGIEIPHWQDSLAVCMAKMEGGAAR